MTHKPPASNRTGTSLVGLDSIVAHLLRDWPQATPVFLRYKMFCVGCSLADFDTLGDALRIYDLPPEPFLADLRRAILEPPASSAAYSQEMQPVE